MSTEKRPPLPSKVLTIDGTDRWFSRDSVEFVVRKEKRELSNTTLGTGAEPV